MCSASHGRTDACADNPDRDARCREALLAELDRLRAENDKLRWRLRVAQAQLEAVDRALRRETGGQKVGRDD